MAPDADQPCRAEASSEGGSDEELLARFQDGSIPNGEFHHEQHVRVAWMFVRQYGMPDALGRFSHALKRFAEAKGAVGLYHETITWAYLLLVAERIARGPSDTWERFAAANPDLLSWKPSLLDRYYNPQTLQSDFARRTFVMPDGWLQPGDAEALEGTEKGKDEEARRRRNAESVVG